MPVTVFSVSSNGSLSKADTGKPPCRSGACRVCLKSFKPDDYSRTCFECQQKVCEDCASYSKLDENQDESTWRCSICRRKMQSRAQPVLAQDSTDSLLDVPVLEGLTRRHSDVKIGSSGAPSGPSGLAPPRSPELRRHSDVSPASLKELEKVAGERREEIRWERELEWRHKRGSAGSAVNSGPTAPLSGSNSPSVERRMFPSENWQRQDGDLHDGGDDEWRRHGGLQPDRGTPNRQTARRKSRVQKQHSYDDEIKGSGQSAGGPSIGGPQGDVGLGIPVPLSRRASAYDVYAARANDPASSIGGLTMNAVSPRNDVSPAIGRRPSFRAQPQPPDPEEPPGIGVTPLSPETAAGCPTLGVGVDEERRTRRRGSMLPDINAITRARGEGTRASINVPRAPEDHLVDTVRRQQSVTDGEAIKIVIHDVDYDPNLSSRTGSKRRVTLKKDPTDKAHRTRGFGMRVVGGKAGADGRLFAYIVWTVPGGPAEKGGLQQGDKVLEWCGVSLVDRSFEEVCSIMDRTGDTAELLVEQGTDLRMCDLLDEPMPGASRKNSGEAVGLQLENEGDKSPASPTRRKLPKTPV